MRSKNYKNVKIVIPTYEPDQRLLELLAQIRDKQQAQFDIILIDDGSGEAYSHIFRKAISKFGCYVLTHSVNKGKDELSRQLLILFLRISQMHWGL